MKKIKKLKIFKKAWYTFQKSQSGKYSPAGHGREDGPKEEKIRLIK